MLDEWNAFLETVMARLVKTWELRGSGAALDYDGNARVTHVNWTDNISILTNSLEQCECMTEELTQALHNGLTTRQRARG